MARIFYLAAAIFWLVMTGLLVRQEVFQGSGAGQQVTPEFMLRLLLDQQQESALQVMVEESVIGSLEIGPLPLEEVPQDQYGTRLFANTLVGLPAGGQVRLVGEAKVWMDKKSLTFLRMSGWTRARQASEIARFEIDFVQRTYEIYVHEGGQDQEERMTGTFEDAKQQLAAEFSAVPGLQMALQGALSKMSEPPAAGMLTATITQLGIRGEKVEAYRLLWNSDAFTGDLLMNQVGQVLAVRTPFGFSLAGDEPIEAPTLDP